MRIVFLILIVAYTFCADCIQIKAKDIAAIRSNPSSVYSIFKLYKRKIPIPNESEAYIIFCMQASHQMAPYGGVIYGDMQYFLKSPYLHCGAYLLLGCLLAENGNKALFDKTNVTVVVWNCQHGWGNHGTVWLNDRIFCDPTTGIYAACSFQDVYEGKNVTILLDWHVRDDIIDYRNRIKVCLNNGLCKNDLIVHYLTYRKFLERQAF